MTMAHGAGGKATQTLIEGLLVPAFGSAALAELGDAGAVTSTGSGWRLTTDSFVVKPIRFPGGSIGELAVNGTVNDLAVAGARAAGADRLAGARGGPAGRELRAEVEAIAAAAEAAGVEIVTRRHQGGRARALRRDVRLHHRARPGRPAREPLAPASIQPGDRVLVSGPIGEHGTAIMLARGELGLDAEIDSDTRSLWPAVDALLGGRRARAALHARRDPRRRRLGPQRARPRLAASRRGPRGATCPSGPRSPARRELLGIDPMYVANEGVLVAFVAPEARRGGAGGAARGAGLRGGGGDRRGAGRAAGDGPGRDRLRRPAGDGPARRRPAAEDLLTCTSWRSRGAIVDAAAAPRRGAAGELGPRCARRAAPGRARARSPSTSRSSPARPPARAPDRDGRELVRGAAVRVGSGASDARRTARAEPASCRASAARLRAGGGESSRRSSKSSDRGGGGRQSPARGEDAMHRTK